MSEQKTGITVRSLEQRDREWASGVVEEEWGGTKIVTRGRVHAADKLPGLIAEMDGERVGLITYDIYGRECELVTMNALRKNAGVGTALLGRLQEIARENDCRGIWLITTNDNLDAMRFYQIKGFYFVDVHRDAIVQARRLKPEIPEIGMYGIPIRDEIELVMPL